MVAKIKVFQKLPAFRRKLLQTENQCLLKQEALQIYYEHNYYIYNNVIVGTTINIQINSKVCIHSKFKLFYKYFLKWIYIILFIEN